MGVVSLMLAQGAAGPAPPASVTWNPADKNANITLSGGNLVATKGGTDAHGALRATLPRDAGDAGGFYFEVVVTEGSLSNFIHIGLATAGMSLGGNLNNADGWAYYQETGAKRHNGVTTAYGASYTTGDVIGVLLKNGKAYFRKNGAWQGSADPDAETGEAFAGLTGDLYPAASLYRGQFVPRHVITARFKASDFSGSLPPGVSAWES